MTLLILSSIEETISQLFLKLRSFLLVVSLPVHQFCNNKVSVNMTMNRMKDLNSTMIIFFQETKYKIYYQHFSSRLNWIKTEQVIPIFCFKNQLFSIETSQQNSLWADELFICSRFWFPYLVLNKRFALLYLVLNTLRVTLFGFK